MENNIFNFIRNHCSIIKIIEKYTSLENKDKECIYYKGRCPLCHEMKFVTNLKKEIFFCFECGKSGDVISFIGLVENISPMDAALKILKDENIDIPSTLEKTIDLDEEQKDLEDWWRREKIKNSGHFRKKINENQI